MCSSDLEQDVLLVRIPLEQDILFRRSGASWMDQRQTAITLVR